MAFVTVRRYLCTVKIASYVSPSLFRYLTTDLSQQSGTLPKFQQIQIKNEKLPLEHLVLLELSSLLPLDLKPPNPFPFSEKPAPKIGLTNASDSLLTPDEKLRGIFLQKVNGKFALESALSATGVSLTTQIFSDVLNKGNLGGEAMLSFFNWAVEQQNLRKSTETFNVVLKALGKKKFLGYMVEASFRMRKEGVKPDLQTLEILFNSFVRARFVSKAVDFFLRLEDIGADCDTEALNILLRCLCHNSHVRVACSVLYSMKGKLPFNLVTYNEIIGGWAKFGMICKVERYWMEMTMDRLNPDCRAYRHLIEAFGRAGRITDVADTFKKMEEQGCLPDTSVYNAMISNFISIGDFEEAVNYYKRITEKNCSPDSDTYRRLIRAFLKAKRVADAIELFNEMLGFGIIPSNGMITSFIKPLCSYGPPHAAMVIYTNARKVGCRVSLTTYKLLFMRLSRFGKGGMLMKLWEEMQGNGYALDTEIYEYIVNALCNIGHVDTAVLVVEEALQKGCCIGRVVYSKLNNKLLESNKVETAYKLFLKVKDARNDANLQRFWRSHGWHF